MTSLANIIPLFFGGFFWYAVMVYFILMTKICFITLFIIQLSPLLYHIKLQFFNWDSLLLKTINNLTRSISQREQTDYLQELILITFSTDGGNPKSWKYRPHIKKITLKMIEKCRFYSPKWTSALDNWEII